MKSSCSASVRFISYMIPQIETSCWQLVGAFEPYDTELFPQNRAQNKNELKPPPKKCAKIYPTLRSKAFRHWIITCSNEEIPSLKHS